MALQSIYRVGRFFRTKVKHCHGFCKELLVPKQHAELRNRWKHQVSCLSAAGLQLAISRDPELFPLDGISHQMDKLVLQLIKHIPRQRDVDRIETIALPTLHNHRAFNLPLAKLCAASNQSDIEFLVLFQKLLRREDAEADCRGTRLQVGKSGGACQVLLIRLECGRRRLPPKLCLVDWSCSVQRVKIEESRWPRARHHVLHLPVCQAKDEGQIATHSAHASSNSSVAMAINDVSTPKQLCKAVGGPGQHLRSPI
mmetsp:Transcript_32049/g.51579  ORF Transcript_32049/g.51579 Transcript_32049/m.51579 type:complete len:255 (+) Transcript_32049:139-903(+)